ncbi:uncharacterized protein LOC126780375 [Nymphalis io]|uniref:uncharacterized protein LOC126780375 n=1 Tax=Inachis io TaxID=171585 RepID=UPI0021678BD5|nr:uncharacterized protein LOC126780375 [Nymphalis io]XP_050360785.1 uncharacterized protein LOC126780375 [Nymphalis io]
MSASGYTNMGQNSWHSMPHHETHNQLRSLRSRSAPIRSSNNVPFPGFCNKVAYYSVYPPSAPLYLLSISSLSHKSKGFGQKPKVMIDEGKIIAQHVLQLVIKSVVHKVVAHTSVNTVSVGSSVHILTQNVAIQTGLVAAMNRHVNNECISSSSSAESCMECEEKWVKDLRTLRNSHVRLVLRQLRQLQDIERLCGVFTTKNLPRIVSSSRQDLGSIETSI